MAHPIYSIIVPAYNSSGTLIELVDRFERVFEEVVKESFEIIFVDDGSSNPKTWKTLENLADEKKFVLAISLMRNYGKPSAVMCGLQHASGNWVLTIDDDLQQSPEDLLKLMNYRNHDVVVGYFGRKRHSLGVQLGSKFKAFFDRLILGVPCPMSPLKLIKSEVVAGMLNTTNPRPFIPALIAGVTQDIVPVPIEHKASKVEKSRYTYWRRLGQFSNLLLGNSSLLLRAIGCVGALASLSGFLFALYTFVRVLSGDEILPGWASLVIINLVFGGLILIALGINGEYLLRILEASSGRPAYSIRKIKKNDEECV